MCKTLILLFAIAIAVLIACSDFGDYTYNPPDDNDLPSINYPPSGPYYHSPYDSSIAPSNVTLKWSSYDPEWDTVTFDIYLGTGNPPELVVSDYGEFSWSPEQVDEYTTYYWKIVAKDSYGNISEGRVWSFETLRTVSLIGSCGWSEGYAYGLSLSANRVYLADGSAGFRIIDIEDPSAPEIIGTHDTWGFTVGICAKDYYVFLASGGDGLQIFDVHNPATPDSIITIKEGITYTKSSAVRDNYLYVCASGELLIVDIADIGNPTITGRCNLPTIGEAISLSGDYAYIAVGEYGIRVLNIADIENPEIIGSMETDFSATDIFPFGNYAYVSDYVYGLIIVDISNLQAPVPVGNFDLPNASYGVCADSQYAYVANSGFGLRIIDIVDPQAPVMIGYYGPPVEGRDVVVGDGLIYVTGGFHDLSILRLE